jgi:3-oxoacyl-[acyl-carrier protein] reductase
VAQHWTGNFRTNVLTAALLTEALRDRLADEGRVVLFSSKRPGTVDDVARTVHWLASSSASHVTAQLIQVNGGALPGR